MRYKGSDRPEASELETSETAEEQLRRKVAALEQQLEEQKRLSNGPAKHWHPSGLTIFFIFLFVTALIVAAFFAGYIPLTRRQAQIASEVKGQEEALPRVEVIVVGRSSANSELELPGNIQAVTEAPILARADGYIKSRMADIGDRVQAGQPLAEIEAPELDQQVRQARANLQQSKAALEQAHATYEQGQSNEELARVTAERWKNLTARGAVSRQENDQYQAQYKAQLSNLQALEKAVAAAESNVAAAEANLARLEEVQSYRVVKAPFAGLITLRNVDVGALVNAGNTLLFRIAQTATLRTYVNVPQINAESVHTGQPARLSVTSLPGRTFTGTVARTASSLDPTSRTMLVEVQVPNADGALLPGMYARVDLRSPRTDPPLLVPGDALIARGDGTQVAMIRGGNTVHLEKVEVGRDYGDRLEIVSGLKPGDTIIANPGDAATEGAKVQPVVQKASP